MENLIVMIIAAIIAGLVVGGIMFVIVKYCNED